MLFVTGGLRAMKHALRDSSGAVLVVVAVAFPALIGFTGLVVDVGNWFEHKRHLQMQADAGALAGAGEFRFPCDSTVDAAVKDMATSYSGVDFNAQIGGTLPGNVLRAFNSTTWPNQTTPVDTTVVEGEPCAAKMIDVKLTETDLPWFFRLFGDRVPFINAHARVALKKQTSSVGPLPVGVPEVDPVKAKAIFVDESTGTEIASTPLTRTGTDGALAIWSNADAPVPVTIDAARIGVRIVLSGSQSTNCGDPLVTCFDAGSANGLALIRGWSNATAGTPTAPQVRGVDLSGGVGLCEDGYFSTSASTCAVSVDATVDFGSAPLNTTRLYVKRAGAQNSTLTALTPPTTAGGVWTGGTFNLLSQSGPVGVELMYRLNCPTDPSATCGGQPTTLGTVHRTFAGSDARSGPIRRLLVSEGGAPGANSFERCATCTHDLVVSIGIQGTLENAQSVSDPVVTLKVAGGGSQNQALDCDPGVPNLKDELAQGCGAGYTENTGTACPNTAAALWGTAQPWQCVAISTGAVTNQVPAGLNLRIHGDEQPASCVSPNNWLDFPDLPRGDPRIVELFLTPFGSFSGSGGNTVPVTGFATFYVTGWAGSGGGFANPCDGQGDDPAGTGSIVGHFIKYIDILNNGGAGEETCDFDAFGRCVAVLTR